MVESITTSRNIPAAWRYVVCTDPVMSGWGHAESKDNVLIFPCFNPEEVDRIITVLRRRRMKRVRLCTAKPRIKPWWFAQVKHSIDYW